MKKECIRTGVGFFCEAHDNQILCDYGIESYDELNKGFENINVCLKNMRSFDGSMDYHMWEKETEWIMNKLENDPTSMGCKST